MKLRMYKREGEKEKKRKKKCGKYCLDWKKKYKPRIMLVVDLIHKI